MVSIYNNRNKIIPTFKVPTLESQLQALCYSDFSGESYSNDYIIAYMTPTNWDGFFFPKKAPGPSDWNNTSLARYNELDGQSYHHFVSVCSDWIKRPSKNEKLICLVPFDDFDDVLKDFCPDLFNILSESLKNFFLCDVRVLDYISSREISLNVSYRNVSFGIQYAADDCSTLVKTKTKDIEGCFCSVGMTMTDLYSQDEAYVFGEGSPSESIGIFSFARFLPTFSKEHSDIVDENEKPNIEDSKKLFIYRCLKVLIHEVGHIFGLAHCVEFECIMNGSNHIQEMDRSPLYMCPVDERKFLYSISNLYQNIDVVDRYEKLMKTWIEIGLVNEAKWISDRISVIKGNNCK